MTANNNYYEILGVDKNATFEQIKQAYKKAALKFHPDKNPGGEAQFKKIGEAYAVLGDEEKRRIYDNNGTTELEKYGYDYGEEIEESDQALVKYTNHIDESNKAWNKVFEYYTSSGKGTPVSHYHLIRMENLLKVLNSYYKEKYLVAKNEIERAKIIPFNFWDHSSGQSNQTAWDNNFNRALSYLNEARKFLGSRALTEGDLRLKVETPGETPQIPGENPKKSPIENGFDINEYNSQYYEANGAWKGGAKHPRIAKYWELRGEILNTAEKEAKYRTANPTLFKEVNDKDAEWEGNGLPFRSISKLDSSEKIAEIKQHNENKLAKMEELIKLMEKLIAEGKKEKNPGSEVVNEQGDKVNELKSNKRKAEEDIRQDNVKKSKTIGDNLKRLIEEAANINTYEALENKIKEIDKYQGEEEYQNRQSDISQLKIKLGNLDKDKFRKLAVEKIKEIMEINNVKESDLSSEEKAELAKLKNENDVSKINQLSIEISEKVGKKGALNTLKDWLEKAKNLVNGVTKGSKDYLEKQLKEVQKGLQGFKLSTNSYQQSVLKDKETEVKQMLEKLEKHSFTGNQVKQENEKPNFKPAVVIPIVLLVVAMIVGAVVIVRNRKRAQIKAKK
ncbi:MAG: DnaJ domain-containing protein [Candidatus Moeniiplasma glomeromycotorum]|nr:DnaJ domain-containing protein [Candidatus Moeniiplasma glomeromycotorum]